MLFTSPESARLVSEEIENNFQPVAQSLDALKERPPRIQSSISKRWIRNVEPFNSNDSRALLGARCKHLKLSATHFYFAKQFLKTSPILQVHLFKWSPFWRIIPLVVRFEAVDSAYRVELDSSPLQCDTHCVHNCANKGVHLPRTHLFWV